MRLHFENYGFSVNGLALIGFDFLGPPLVSIVSTPADLFPCCWFKKSLWVGVNSGYVHSPAMDNEAIREFQLVLHRHEEISS